MRPCFRVKEYNQTLNFHVLIPIDDDTKEYRMDILVDGSFPDGTDPNSLVGKVVSMDYYCPYVSIGMDVKEEASDGTSSL